MNLVILDGKISSMIERSVDPRRTLARFTVATHSGDEVGIEVRGSGAEKLCKEWEPGDTVEIRGRLTTAGYVAADTIRRLRPSEPGAPAQIGWSFFRGPAGRGNVALAMA
ncbi:MAG: hypothetical protein AAB229_06990 [Candidatus Hydrogenedentota bacterium]